MNQHPLSSILLLQTMPTIPQILATTALCLAVGK